MSTGDNVKVAVRVRPFNEREKARGATLIIEMDGNMTRIRDPSNMSSEPRPFAFDYSYWSHDGYKDRGDGYFVPVNPRYADQEKVFNDLGAGVLENAWKGYNCSLFAYGQTGSGKSYSMVGFGANKGIIPIASDTLFKQIEEKKAQGSKTEFQVTVSMLEIYCEKVKDLLAKKDEEGGKKGGMKIREHPQKGFYVEGLLQIPVGTYKEIQSKIDQGSKSRTIAATNMNSTSSRAHTIFAINFAQKDKSMKTSSINLVDLAGSERQREAKTEGDRLKEGIIINKSLSTLGRCIKSLAEAQHANQKGKIQVPFRDSVLTSLLKNALGGNSKTVMIAALSPADINYEETLSTLRFADRAKSIRTHAIVNENDTSRLIRELKEENQRLQELLKGGGISATGPINNEELESLRGQLENNKREMTEMAQTWQERLNKARSKSSGSEDRSEIAKKRKVMPHFWNLNEDPALTDMIVHFAKDEESKVGNGKGETKPAILLSGFSIQKDHARVKNSGNKKVTLVPMPGAKIFVNGKEINEELEIFHNDRVHFGGNHLYVFAHPYDAEKNRDRRNLNVTYDMAQAEIAKFSGIIGERSGPKSKEDMILEEELIKLLPMVSQANAMSEELNKKASFEIVLVAPQARGLEHGMTEIYVKLHNQSNDSEFLWEKDKFIDRYYGMQEVYNSYIDGVGGKELPKDRDPFYESPDTEVQLGVVLVYLQSLAYMVEVDELLPITDFKGTEKGHLKVALMPCSQDGQEILGQFVDNPDELVGKALNFKVKVTAANGIPRRFISTRCQYRFFAETKEVSSAEVSGSNPSYNQENLFRFKPVTKQLVKYLKESALVIAVFGKQSHKRVGSAKVPKVTITRVQELEIKLHKVQILVNDALTQGQDSIPVKTLQKALRDEKSEVENGHTAYEDRKASTSTNSNKSKPHNSNVSNSKKSKSRSSSKKREK